MTSTGFDGELIVVTGAGQDPENVATPIEQVSLQPAGTAIAEVVVRPTQETSRP
jgi:hypothetical protein